MASNDAAEYPLWARLVAGATSEERKLLHELRTICNDAGFDVHDLHERAADLMCPASIAQHVRLLELQHHLGALGTWDRLDALVAEYHAAVAPGPEVQTMIVYSPTDEKEYRDGP